MRPPAQFEPDWRWMGRFVLGLAGLAVVGVVDLVTGKEVAMSVLYLFPILLLTWSLGPGPGYLLSVLSAGTWLWIEYKLEVPYSHGWIHFWNAGVRLSFFVVVAWLLGRIRYLTRNLERLVKARTSELAREVERRRQVEAEVAEVSQREQTRLAHELHDRLGAHLAGVAFRSKVLAEKLERRGVTDATEASQVVALVNGAMDEIRGFARWLSPSDDDVGLGAGLSRLGADFETLFGITCLVEVPKGFPALSSEQVRQLYRIAQEAIRNAVKHGRAQCVEIRIQTSPEGVVLRVSSDGEAWEGQAHSREGLGLRIMEYRARMLGGKLHIQASAEGGCVVECHVPLRGDAAEQGASTVFRTTGVDGAN